MRWLNSVFIVIVLEEVKGFFFEEIFFLVWLFNLGILLEETFELFLFNCMCFLWNKLFVLFDELLFWRMLWGFFFLRIGFRLVELGDFDGIVGNFVFILLFVVGSFDERNLIFLEFLLFDDNIKGIFDRFIFFFLLIYY